MIDVALYLFAVALIITLWQRLESAIKRAETAEAQAEALRETIIARDSALRNANDTIERLRNDKRQEDRPIIHWQNIDTDYHYYHEN